MADNYLEENPEQFVNLADPPVYSLSKESGHTGDLILVMYQSLGMSEIYRLAATHDDENG